MKPGFALRAVVYQRVSTDRQAAEGISLEAQEALARQRCEAEGWVIGTIYTDVMSGRSSKRPQFQRLLADAKRKAFDVVLVYRTDRLARSTLRLLQTVSDFQDYGVALVSLTEKLDLTTPQGRAFFQILASFAELESANTGLRVRDAMRHRATGGSPSAGPPPDGYRREEGRFVIDEERAPIIREAFRLYQEGRSLRATCDALNAQGALSRNGSPWRIDALRKILENPAHLGASVYGRYTFRRTGTGTRKKIALPRSEWIWVDDAHEPIIDRATFESVQDKLQERSKIPARRLETMEKSPWSGLLRCPMCGFCYDYNTNTQKGRKDGSPLSYLRCSSYGRAGRAACRYGTMVYEASLERYGVPALDAALREHFKEAAAKAKPPQGRRLKRAPSRRERIEALEASIKREADIYRAGAQSLEVMSANVKELRSKLESIQGEPEQADTIALAPPMPRTSLTELWSKATILDRGDLLRKILERIDVFPDRCEAIPRPEFRWCLGEAIPFRRSARTPDIAPANM